MLHYNQGKLYLPIFTELAEFLIINSRIPVYFLHLNSENKTKTLLTLDNMKVFLDRFEESIQKKVLNGGLFAEVGKMPIVEVSFDLEESTKLTMKQSYNNYPYYNWD
jgi:hypothetical protein